MCWLSNWYFMGCYRVGGDTMDYKHIEYMCTYCGARKIKGKDAGRPEPGKCPRRQGDRPHSWRINRKF